MKPTSNRQTIDQINFFSANQIPFLFVISYDMMNNFVIPLSDTAKEGVLFYVEGLKNFDDRMTTELEIKLRKSYISFQEYTKAFSIVQNYMRRGDSYLTNLTFPTEVEINCSLRDIFDRSNSPYRLLFKNKFVVFSPETFVKIKDNKIYSYPMKGTIDANIPNAKKLIMNDKKELAEHITIVDLIRNDLSMAAKNVRMERFRYIDRLKTDNKELLQVSSCISGELPADYNKNLGDIIFRLLPAGSICGAPKNKTLEIIEEAEIYERGFYTGVFGISDGTELKSAVMIRFIENNKGKFIFKSGGGITVSSSAKKEYEELKDKVYLPFAK